MDGNKPGIIKTIFTLPAKLQYNSPLILSFAILSALVLLLDYLTGSDSSRLLFAVYQAPFTDPLFYVRLFGHSLGHANLSHYLNNFLIILLVGPVLEEKYGSKRLLYMVIITTLLIGILHIAFSAVSASNTMLLGASGVVFMFIILNSYVNLKEGRIPLTLVLCVLLYLGREVAEQLSFSGNNISHFSHIIGGVCGAFFGYWINFRKGNVSK
jgi:membrane associated rhomboid family serine protease